MNNDDEMCVAGGPELPEHLINHDMIEFTNYPEDELSIHILRLIALHLKGMNDAQKKEIVSVIQKVLGIKPLKKIVL